MSKRLRLGSITVIAATGWIVLSTAIAAPKPLTSAEAVAIASQFSIAATENAVREGTSVTIRRPYASANAYLSMPRPESVRPEAEPDGVMSVRKGGRLSRVGDIPPAADALEYSSARDPLHASFPSDAVVAIDHGYVQIHAVTSAHVAYVVSCHVSGVAEDAASPAPSLYGVHVSVEGKYSRMIRELTPAAGRVSFALPRRKSKRIYDLRLFAYRAKEEQIPGHGPATTHALLPFSLSACDIIPIQ